MDETQNKRWGVILSYISLAVGVVGTLLVTNRVLNCIGDYNYGLYSFVNSITTWLTILSNALSASFLRYTTLEAKENHGNTGKTNTIYLKLLSALGIVILIVGISSVSFLLLCHCQLGKYNWEDSKLMYSLFALSILNVALTLPTSIFVLHINYKKKFAFAKLVTICTTVLNFISHFIIAYITKDIVLISAFTIVITLITFVINYWFSRVKTNIKFSKVAMSDNRTLVKSIIVFSSVLLLNSIVDQINCNVDKTLLGIYSIPENVTIYQIGQQISIYLCTMSVAVSGVYAPTIHQLVAEGNQNELNRLYLKVSRIQIIIVCLITFGFMSCGYDFILSWMGPNRINAYYIGLILMLIDLCPLTMNTSIEIQRAENKHRFRAFVYLGVAITNILLSVLFLKIMRSENAVFACLIGSVIARICSHWIAMNIYNKVAIKLPVGRYMLVLVKYIIIGLVSFGIAYYLKANWLIMIESSVKRFILEGGIYVVVYGALVIVFDYAFKKTFYGE